MEVFVDADACPVVRIVEDICKELSIKLTLICDNSHNMNSSYADVIYVDKGNDSTDYKLANMIRCGDIAVTQDYGLAAMVLAKKGVVIHQSGMIIDDNNILLLLENRAFNKKMRMSKEKHHLKGPAKRTALDDARFIDSFMKIVKK